MTMIILAILGIFLFTYIAGPLGAKVYIGLVIVFLVFGTYNACFDTRTEKEKEVDAIIAAKELEEMREEIQEALKTEDDFAQGLPYRGIDLDKLKYTSIGAPDETKKYTHFTVSYTYYWYTDNGELLAEGGSSQSYALGEKLSSFNYYGEEYGYDANGFYIEPTPTPTLEPTQPPLQPIENIIIIGASELVVEEVETYSLEILPDEYLEENIIWTSSDETIAVVSDGGVVTAISEGEVIISVIAEDTGLSAEFELSVQADYEQLELSTDSVGNTSMIETMYSLCWQFETLASGGTGDYEYKFEILQNSYITKTLDWSNANKVDIILSGDGTCELRVYVRDSRGSEIMETIDLLEQASLLDLDIYN